VKKKTEDKTISRAANTVAHKSVDAAIQADTTAGLAVKETRKSLHAKRSTAMTDLGMELGSLRGMVEIVASRGHACHSLRRELTAAQRVGMLLDDGCLRPGMFEERQLALEEESRQLRKTISDLGNFSGPAAKVLRLAIILREEGQDKSHECGDRRDKAEEPYSIIAEVIYQWGKMARLCELKDFGQAGSRTDAPDLFAATFARAIPSQETIDAIVAAGTTCFSLLQDFCDYRGLPTA
jgi:hypothetical protein